jgi:hypothetical protein
LDYTYAEGENARKHIAEDISKKLKCDPITKILFKSINSVEENNGAEDAKIMIEEDTIFSDEQRDNINNSFQKYLISTIMIPQDNIQSKYRTSAVDLLVHLENDGTFEKGTVFLTKSLIKHPVDKNSDKGILPYFPEKLSYMYEN